MVKCLIQRVKRASVTIDNEIYSKIQNGILTLIGIEKGDVEENITKMCEKIVNLRIFEDETGRMNKSLKDVNGEMLIVSQFTLCGDCKKGTRPSFDRSEKPEVANILYEDFVTKVKNAGINVATGKFGAMMNVELVNDGPVTFMLEK